MIATFLRKSLRDREKCATSRKGASHMPVPVEEIQEFSSQSPRRWHALWEVGRNSSPLETWPGHVPVDIIKIIYFFCRWLIFRVFLLRSKRSWAKRRHACFVPRGKCPFRKSFPLLTQSDCRVPPLCLQISSCFNLCLKLYPMVVYRF